jgi:ribosomal protein S18 acetylase RimI-like enzyme
MINDDLTYRIVPADYGNPLHAAVIVQLLDEYARGPTGGGAALSETVKKNLVPALAHCGNATSAIAFVDDQPVGLLNAFQTLSTFRAQPLLNIHDIVVSEKWRRLGIARRLLQFIEQIARERGCCKLTLEVLEGNRGAQALYGELGFSSYSLREEFGNALFWQKEI